MSFRVPAGKHGVILPLSTPSFVTCPVTCMAPTLPFLHQLPLVLPLFLLLPEDQGFMNPAATPTLPYPPPQYPHAVHHLVTADFLLSQAKGRHFLVTLLLFIHSGNTLEHLLHIGHHARCLVHIGLLNLGHVPKH